MSALKNFVITFLISALIFGSVAYFATQFLTDTITGIFDAEKSELDSILNPSNPSDTTPSTDQTKTIRPPNGSLKAIPSICSSS